jgi:hypothetical protein
LAQLNKNQIPRRQGILGRDQVIFTMKGCISAFKERKNTCEPVCSITKKKTAAIAELHPQGQNCYRTFADIHKALAKI